MIAPLLRLSYAEQVTRKYTTSPLKLTALSQFSCQEIVCDIMFDTFFSEYYLSEKT